MSKSKFFNAHQNSMRLASFISGFLIVMAVGCGASSSTGISGYLPGYGTNPVNCGTGYAVGNVCGSTFENACYYAYGQMISADICRVDRQYPDAYLNTVGVIPRLNPGDTFGGSAWDSGVDLYAGDRMVLTADGGYGSLDSHSLLWGAIHWYSTSSCDQVGVNGVNSDGALMYYNGTPAMLMATDGGEVFQVGSGVSRTQPRSGRLKIGFNAPYAASDICSTSHMTLRVLHCQSRTGGTIACPY